MHLSRGRAEPLEPPPERTGVLLAAVVAASPDIILVVDHAGRIRSAGAALERVLGWDVDRNDAAAPVHLHDLVHPDDMISLQGHLDRLAATPDDGFTVRLRVGGPSADGWLHVEATGRPLHGLDEPGLALLVLRDISRQRRAEEAQRHARDAAEYANRSKSEFLSRMSHELRTPLNAVLGFAQLLELDDLTDDQAAAVHHIRTGGEHLLALINEVLDISRIDAGVMSMSIEPIGLHDVLTEAMTMVHQMADARGVQFEGGFGVTCDVTVTADRQRLRQVLLNVLSNAVKYNREGGTVTVDGSHRDDAFVLTVADTGAGIAAEQQPMLFTPFERLGAEQTEVEGTGVGLALSKRLAEAMGGDLWLASSSSAGSVFAIGLRTADPPTAIGVTADPVSAPGRSGAADRPSTSSGDTPDASDVTVVYVEDNAANHLLMQALLRRRPRVRLLQATSAATGIPMVLRHRPSLVLLDVHLPDADGAAVLRRMKGDPRTGDIPVVVVSADATRRQRERMLELGAADYLTKPIDVHQLLSVIDRLLAERWSDDRT